jgi:aldose 1-epimerase
MPCGFGTHAYFRLPLTDGSQVDEAVMTVPVERFWEVEQMIPTGRLLPIRLGESLATGLPLGEHQFDTCFTGVRADSDGRVRTRIIDPSSGRTLTQTFDKAFTQCVVYTPGHRQALCIEPYTCVPDAVRLAAAGHETGLQILQPGDSFETEVQIEVQ